jgi:hypothetical protein
MVISFVCGHWPFIFEDTSAPVCVTYFTPSIELIDAAENGWLETGAWP